MISQKTVNERRKKLNEMMEKYNELKDRGKWQEAFAILIKALTYANESLKIAASAMEEMMKKTEQEKKEVQDKKMIVIPKKDTKH